MKKINNLNRDDCGAVGSNAKQSLLEKAIREFDDKDFEKFVWQNYLLKEEEFLQYDVNCQSQLISVYQRCYGSKNKKKSSWFPSLFSTNTEVDEPRDLK